MYKSKFNQLYNQIITQMVKLTTNANKKLLEYKKIENQYNQLMNKYNNLLNKSKEAQTKILQLHPELTKKIEQIKLKPKQGYNASSKLRLNGTQFHSVVPGYEDIYTGSMYESNLVSTFGNSLYQAYNLNKEITRAKNKLDSLKLQLGDLTTAISNSDQMVKNLPQAFIDVLNKLKQYIISIQQQIKNDTIYKAEIRAANPLKSALYKAKIFIQEHPTTYKMYGNAEYETINILLSQNPNINLSDPELTDNILQPLYKNAKITFYKKLYKTDSLDQNMLNNIDTKYTEELNNIRYNANNSLKNAQNINAIGYGTQIFNEIKAQFLDKLSQYCTKIISAEDVYLGQDGSINGIVHAENGTFHVRTIEAGGYNIQKLHFRVIITPVKENKFNR